LKPFIIILLCSFSGYIFAQQSNHLVVQGFIEQFNIDSTPLSESNKKTIYYDLDFNRPIIKVNEINSKKIWEIPRHWGFPIYHKLGQGYQTISNFKGDLIAFVYCNTLFDKNGDSIDYIPQFGGKRGTASAIGKTDTFLLYYIRTKTDYNGPSFEKELTPPTDQFNKPYPDDTFYLVEAKYFKNKLISTKRFSSFLEFGNLSQLQSNVKILITKSKEMKLQFVWNQYLYEINISNQFVKKKCILEHKQINANYHSNLVWLDNNSGHTTSEIVTSPSGRWSVFNWHYEHFDLSMKNFSVNHVKYSLSKVILIDNENDLNFKVILEDSGDYNGKKIIRYWKNAIFTKKDSVLLIPEFQSTLNQFGLFTNSLLELNLSNNSINIQKVEVKLDSIYFNNLDVTRIIQDYCLSSNGNNYVLLKRVIKKQMLDSTFINMRQIEIGKFYKTNNYYTVSNPLKISISVGNISLNRPSALDKIFFPATPTPYHYINFTNKSICNDLTHEFTNETDTSWFDHFMWFWGDGDSSKTLKSQTKIRHQYSQPGKYQILLKSITADGGWVWYSDSVEILPEPIAKYETKNTVGCQWIAVSFADSSLLENKAHNWHWDFGDGTDSSIVSINNIMPKNKSIKHTYTTSGKFNVQLQVSDGRCIDTFNAIQNISILPAPRPGIAIDKTTGCTPLEVQFGRIYSDLTDSTIYYFKPALVPINRFSIPTNKTTILQSGHFTLFQKLYGPSGCITQDSVKMNITPGIPVGYRPELKRSTVINNRTILTEWKPVPHAKYYQVYRNGSIHDVVNDSFFKDYLLSEIEQSYTYQIQAIDSCDQLGGNKSNIGKTIYLEVKEVEPLIKSNFATALLTWTPYEDWTLNGGVKEYQCLGTYDLETANWQPLTNLNDTQFNDKNFIQPKKFEKCFVVKARSGNLLFESQSNIFCLPYQATLFAPSAFTPNGDGLNDEFDIFNYGFDHFSLSIFNSWGQKIFEQNNSEGKWKPEKDVPQGVYVYYVKAYRKGKEYEFSNTVTLLK